MTPDGAGAAAAAAAAVASGTAQEAERFDGFGDLNRRSTLVPGVGEVEVFDDFDSDEGAYATSLAQLAKQRPAGTNQNVEGVEAANGDGTAEGNALAAPAGGRQKAGKKTRSVRRSFVGKFKQNFVFGDIPRAAAEATLREHGLHDGLFLVRAKSTQGGTFAVSLVCGARVEHHVLVKTDAGYTVNGTAPAKPCATIGDIVEHLSANKEGMTRCLGQAVKNPLSSVPSLAM